MHETVFGASEIIIYFKKNKNRLGARKGILNVINPKGLLSEIFAVMNME